MRLTILNQFYPPDISPTAHLAASLAEHRASRGDQVTVVASHGGYVEAKPKEADQSFGSLHVKRIWTPQLGKRKAMHRLLDYASFYAGAAANLLTMPAQDAIITLTTPPFIAGAAIMHRMGRPGCRVILWNMDCYPEAIERLGVIRAGGFVSRFLRSVNRLLYRKLSRLICLDDAMADMCRVYQSRSGRPTIEVIPNWERERLFPSPRDQNSKRLPRRFGPGSPLGVLYLGNLGFGHSVETVTQAAVALRDEPVHFRFVGGGKRWSRLNELKAAHCLANVALEGYVPKGQTPDLLAAADAALITLDDASLGVMSPSKLHSNLAAGLPIIYVGPARSNVDEAIRQFECGVSLRNGDEAGLTAAIRRMLADPGSLHRFSDNARQAFEDAYCDRAVLPQFDAILDT